MENYEDKEKAVLYSERKNIAYITLNSPDRRNSLTTQGIDALADAWVKFEAGSARVAILSGSGGSFCSGIDLATLPDPAPAVPGIGSEVTKPVIAAISGAAVGLGLTLTVQADLAIADQTAFFRYPEGYIGFTGGLIAGLVVRVPSKIAMQIMLLGDRFDATRACEAGLINEVVDVNKLLSRAKEMAEIIAGAAPIVIRALKAEIDEVLPRSPAEVSGRFRSRIDRISASADRNEGLAAFQEKRRPNFSGE